MRITSKGQVTIPREVRERLGLLPETEVEFVVKGNAVQIVKAGRGTTRGANVVAGSEDGPRRRCPPTRS